MLGIHRAYVGGCGIYSMPTLPMEVDSRKLLCKSLKTGTSAQACRSSRMDVLESHFWHLSVR